MRISGWSSDVCSSDLKGIAKEQVRGVLPEGLVPTRLYLHFSIRTWIHYIEERTKVGVQREHRWLGYRSEEHTSELQSLMRISYAVFCLKKKKLNTHNQQLSTTSTANYREKSNL